MEAVRDSRHFSIDKSVNSLRKCDNFKYLRTKQQNLTDMKPAFAESVARVDTLSTEFGDRGALSGMHRASTQTGSENTNPRSPGARRAPPREGSAHCSPAAPGAPWLSLWFLATQAAA